MNKDNLQYTHTRLQIQGATVFLAVNTTKSVVEQLHPVLILDNEYTKNETYYNIDIKTYNLLKGHFESLHGKKLPRVDLNITEEYHVVETYPIEGLEDEDAYVVIDECYDEFYTKRYFISLISKISESHSIEIGKDIFKALTRGM